MDSTLESSYLVTENILNIEERRVDYEHWIGGFIIFRMSFESDFI